jgi:hypothetical protein
MTDNGPSGGHTLIGLLIAILLAALAYWVCVALGLPAVVGVIVAIIVIIGGIGGVGWGGPGPRW